MLHRPTPSTLASALALAAVLFSATTLSAAGEPSLPPAFSAGGRWLAMLTGPGEFLILDLESGTRRVWSRPGAPVSAFAFEPPVPLSSRIEDDAPPPLVVASGAAASTGASTLFRLQSTSGEILSKADVPLAASFLLPASGSRRVYACGLRADRWSIVSVDLAGAGAAEGPFTLPAPVHGAALASDESRVYLAGDDSLRTFSTQPLRSSWQLRSPGANGALLPIQGGDLLAARGRRLAVFDPGRLPGRDPATGAFPTDDAARVIPLPFDLESLAVQPGGRLAAVLGTEGGKLAIVDLIGGTVLEVRAVATAVGAVFRLQPDRLLLIAPGAATVVNLPLALPVNESPAAAAEAKAPAKREAAPVPSSSATAPESTGAVPPSGATAPPSAGAVPPSATTPPPPAASAPPPGATASPSAGTTPTSSATAPPPATTAPTDAVPAGSTPSAPGEKAGEAQPARPAASASEPPAGSEGPGPTATAQPSSPAPGEKTGETQTTAPPAPPPPPVTPGKITGRITGEIALARAVVLYGPNSIFRESTRVAPGPDGAFEIPLPAPGVYRIVLQGASSATLSDSPAYYQITVAGLGIAGIDFNVAGRILGTIKP